MIHDHSSQFLDSSFETLLDSILTTASEVCGVPLALIAFKDGEKEIFKPSTGHSETVNKLRDTDLTQAIVTIGTRLEISDATQDDRFWDKDYVVEVPHVRFIAGVPITLPLGEISGILCVVDTQPRYLNAQQRTALDGLANVVAKTLVARETSVKLMNRQL